MIRQKLDCDVAEFALTMSQKFVHRYETRNQIFDKISRKNGPISMTEPMRTRGFATEGAHVIDQLLRGFAGWEQTSSEHVLLAPSCCSRQTCSGMSRRLAVDDNWLSAVSNEMIPA